MSGPVLRDDDDSIKAGQPDSRYAQIQHKWPTALQNLGTCESLPPGNVTEALRKFHHAPISAFGFCSGSWCSFSDWINRRREASKSNSSAYLPQLIAVSNCRSVSSSLNCSSSTSWKNSSGTLRSLLDSIARTICRNSNTCSIAAFRNNSFCRRISELAYSAPVGVISASPSVTFRKPSNCAASTIGSRSSI